MSSLYCFRHGQAGLRDDYDTLSETGQRQARALGDFLAARNMTFDAFYTGALNRQRQTALAIRDAYRAAGVEIPDLVIDTNWNEFDLGGVYRGIAPQLAEEDPEFRREYEALERESADAASAVHRRWTAADVAVVRAWIEGRYACQAESWAAFTGRVRKGLDALAAPRGRIAVSTSATPIGVWMGLALRLENRYIMRAAGALYNASITTFRLRGGEVHLSTFNQVGHFADPSLLTFR
ncbi:MAG: histidine phosphatase family protein [Bryobacterales bacterium]|nr:histidine phosphatase family protein [Bryobacterales bacterium]